MRTKEKLTLALEQAGAPKDMVDKARKGRYDDFESDSATPIVDLVTDLKKAQLHDLAKKAMDGEFDASKEEGEEWFNNEGRHLL